MRNLPIVLATAANPALCPVELAGTAAVSWFVFGGTTAFRGPMPVLHESWPVIYGSQALLAAAGTFLYQRPFGPGSAYLTAADERVGDHAVVDTMPPEALLAGYPRPMRAIAQRLRAVVRRAVPDAIERVRPGWRLIGYDVPKGPRRVTYFCYVAPEAEHVHLGFEYGVFMSDPDGVLIGRGVTRKVRWLTFRAGDPIDDQQLVELVREGAMLALASRAERLGLVLDREERAAFVR